MESLNTATWPSGTDGLALASAFTLSAVTGYGGDVMDSRVTVRFYRVHARSDDQPDFGAVLENMVGMDDDALTAEVGDITMGAFDLVKEGSVISGDLARHQSDNLPSILQKKKKPKKLDLPDGGALGHHTAFRFDTRTGMLAYQFTRNAVSMSHFNLYVAQFAGCETFHFLPVLQLPKLKELASLHAKTLLIKVAEPHDLEAIEDTHKELRDSLVSLKDFAGGAYVRVQVGLGRHKGQLDKGVVREAVGWLLEQWAKKRGEIKTLKIIGKDVNPDDDDDTTALDFLKAHLGDNEILPLKGLSPADSYKVRSEFLKKIMTRHSATLKAMAQVDP
jgi:hypothetical protein